MKDKDFLGLLKTSDINALEEAPPTQWIDTGSYIFNALISGSIYGGIPSNRSIMLAGESSAGKSYLALSCIETWQIANPKGQVLFFDTEHALEKRMLSKRKIDVNRFHIIQVETLEDFRTKCINFLDNYQETKSKTPVLLCLDSLGNLPTQKEVADALSGSDKKDMTKAPVIRSIFRVITQRLGICNIPLLICNHVYDAMDQYTPVVISGGKGAIYAASTIITLSKSKDKDGTEVVGNLIRATTRKSRYTKENHQVIMQLDYETGLNRYYGLLELAEKYDIIKKVSTRYEIDGVKYWGKDIRANPEKFFTKDILDKLDDVAKLEFGLGEGSSKTETIDDIEESIDEAE